MYQQQHNRSNFLFFFLKLFLAHTCFLRNYFPLQLCLLTCNTPNTLLCVSTQGCRDVFQWWGSSSRAPHWSTRRHYKIMGEYHASACFSYLLLECYFSHHSQVTVSPPAFSFCPFIGDSSIWNKGCHESQFFVKRRRQPHRFHQNQNQRSQWGPVHHPPCRSGGHLRYFTKLQYCVLLSSKHYSHLVSVIYLFDSAFSLFLVLYAAPGIYSSTEMLDFGTLRSQGKSTSLNQHGRCNFFFFLK